MNEKQYQRMKLDKGFIAALDQSGGSTPKALATYGVGEDQYHNDQEMFDQIHAMRTRIIKSPSFTNQHILGAILFEDTMNKEIDGLPSADYLWEKKGIVPFLKIDKGLANEEHGVQLMKPIPGLQELLQTAVSKHIFGTKMRSVIKAANKEGIAQIVQQQFEIGLQIAKMGLVPILEPEVDIHIKDKKEAETILLEEIKKHLDQLDDTIKIMLKISIPSTDNFYAELMNDPHMVRIVALSGGYSREEANEKLARNHGLIASFSRALSEGLNAQQSEKEFDDMMKKSIDSIYQASIQ